MVPNQAMVSTGFWQLPNGIPRGRVPVAMGFANPPKGEPPDDFRADNSYL
jgi:hypothetical protein